MTAEYRIEPSAGHFIVIDPWGERLVDDYPNVQAAERDIERYKKEDAMWETAKQLMEAAIKTHMQIHGVDRATSQYWIESAVGGA